MAMLQPPTLTLEGTSISGLLHALDENKLASFSTSRGTSFGMIRIICLFSLIAICETGNPSSVHYLTDV